MSAKLLDYEVLAPLTTANPDSTANSSGTFGTQRHRIRSRITGKLFVRQTVDYGRLSAATATHLMHDIHTLKQLNHPHIVRYFNHILVTSAAPAATLYIIVECCDQQGADLGALIVRARRDRCRFEEPFVWRCTVQLAGAVQAVRALGVPLGVLQADLRPANVHLDAGGNVKLGEFGWRAAAAAADGTSDVRSLGSVAYELCALRPPPLGVAGNAVDGRFEHVPAAFSGELHALLSLMLGAGSPTVEAILQHATPVLARMAAGVEMSFPQLVPAIAEQSDDWFTPQPDLSSTRMSAASSESTAAIAAAGGGLFAADSTDDLRRQLFNCSAPASTNGDDCHSCYSGDDGTRSEPGAPQRQPEQQPLKKAASDGRLMQRQQQRHQSHGHRDPNEITQEVFGEALRQRLLSIREREAELRRQEAEMRCRERALQEREREQQQQQQQQKRDVRRSGRRQSGAKPSRPISLSYDATSLSVEPNDTVADGSLLPPTVAKFDGNAIRRPKAFTTLPKSSRPAFINPGDDEHTQMPPPLPARNRRHRPVSMAYSQQELAEAVSNALAAKTTTTAAAVEAKASADSKPSILHRILKAGSRSKAAPTAAVELPTPVQRPPTNTVVSDNDVAAGAATDIPSKWTDETKRTAFAMLAAMNANNQRRQPHPLDQTVVDEVLVNDRLVRHDRKRQSMMVVLPGAENRRPPMTTFL